jgi:hypothetical protein
MRHIAIMEQPARAPHMRRFAMHVIVALVGAAFYVAGGWLVLTHVLGDGDLERASTMDLGRGEGVSVTVSVMDGPTLQCATAPNTVASDTIEITAKELRDVIGELGCWERSD